MYKIEIFDYKTSWIPTLFLSKSLFKICIHVFCRISIFCFLHMWDRIGMHPIVVGTSEVHTYNAT